MARKKKHRGVTLLKPEPARLRKNSAGEVIGRSGAMGWRVRYADPDTGKMKKRAIPDNHAKSAVKREAYAVDLAAELAERRAELDAGAARCADVDLQTAFAGYFEAHRHLGATTIAGRRRVVARFEAWAKSGRVHSTGDLTRGTLAGFRVDAINRGRHNVAIGGDRGERIETREGRSVVTINSELADMSAILNWLWKVQRLPRLTRDDIGIALEKLRRPKKRIVFLKPVEARDLLEAALRHDAECHQLTRAEKAGEREAGTTAKHGAVGPFTAAALLSGMRFAELVALDWGDVDLDARDNAGRKVGEIIVRAPKTKAERVVGLEVSPALRRLLVALRLATGGRGSVFGFERAEGWKPGDRDGAYYAMQKAHKRLRAEYDAPEAFNWQACRATTGTILANSPAIFGAAASKRAADLLGHSPQVAHGYYHGVLRGIDPEARTIEDALGIAGLVDDIIGAVTANSGLRAA